MTHVTDLLKNPHPGDIEEDVLPIFDLGVN